MKTARDRHTTFPAATEIENLAGKGIQAHVEGTDVLVGAMRAFAGDPSAGKDQSLAATLARLGADGQTTGIVRRGAKFIGNIALGDEPRPQVKEVMQRLRAQGIERLVMLTGESALRLLAWKEWADHLGLPDSLEQPPVE